ncbi:MAG TPA: STAS domain-containing protein [Candidatus Baltobacteraceae bacterium]|nr:STAS domain-containing protein [Candidatus Baltobacteraceae bacterium]
MSERVPIIQIGRILLASIQVDLSDETTIALQEDLSQRIVDGHARGVLIDISALEIVDSFIGRMLASIASISRILDAKTIVVGMRPAVAITLTELGLSLEGIQTALNAEHAFELLGEDEDDISNSASELLPAEVAE